MSHKFLAKLAYLQGQAYHSLLHSASYFQSFAMLEWTLRSAAQPIAWAFSFSFTCLVVGRFPDLNKWTGFLLLAAPAYGALQASPSLTPSSQLNDIFSRYVIIMFSHMVALNFMQEDSTSVRHTLGDGRCDSRLNTEHRCLKRRPRISINRGRRDGSVRTTYEASGGAGRTLTSGLNRSTPLSSPNAPPRPLSKINQSRYPGLVTVLRLGASGPRYSYVYAICV